MTKLKETIIDTIMNIANQIFSDTIVLAVKLIMVGLWMLKPFFSTAKSVKLQIGNIKEFTMKILMDKHYSK